MTYDYIRFNGEYLGYCEVKCYLYSVPAPRYEKGCQVYQIVAICGVQPKVLIEHLGEPKKEECSV